MIEKRKGSIIPPVPILGQFMPVPYFEVHYFLKDSMGAAIKPRRVRI